MSARDRGRPEGNSPIKNLVPGRKALEPREFVHLLFFTDRRLDFDPRLPHVKVVVLDAHAADARKRLLGVLLETLGHKPTRRLGRKVDTDAEDQRPQHVEAAHDAPGARRVLPVQATGGDREAVWVCASEPITDEANYIEAYRRAEFRM